VKDYWEEQLPADFDSPNFTKLCEIIDAWYYFDRLTMPKFIANSCDDEFQRPDATHLYWD